MAGTAGPAPRRLLLALPQSLYDLGSGAAVSMRLLACQLALRGWQVQALCTSATESGQPGLPPPGPRWPAAARTLQPATAGEPPRCHLRDAGIDVELWCLPPGTRQDWERHAGAAFDRRCDELLAQFAPTVLLTFGADARDHRLAARARAQGVRVVLALHNLAYLRRALPPFDALLAPSRFLAQRHADAGLAPVGVLPPPMWDADTRVAGHDPLFFTFVNPEPAKGAALVARLAAALPALPFLVVGGRSGADGFAAVARALGLDPARLGNVTVSPGGVPVRELLAVTRAVLMPSLVEEAAGRVAAEALDNGIPALVSDRGGLPEIATPGGRVLPLGRDAAGRTCIDEACVARWAAALRQLADDAAWRAAAQAAAAASARWDVAAQATAADRWFGAVADAPAQAAT